MQSKPTLSFPKYYYRIHAALSCYIKHATEPYPYFILHRTDINFTILLHHATKTNGPTENGLNDGKLLCGLYLVDCTSEVHQCQ